MQIWIWAPLMLFLWTFFLAWLLIRHFLKGPSLLAYDNPPLDRHAGSRDRASPEHQEAVRLLERSSAEIRSVPRKQRLETVRGVMARGFCEPPLLAGASEYRIQAANAGGVPGEWVLAPDSDPDRRLLYLHGGSFISGCPHGHRVITTQLARVSRASVLALDYRLMPEHSRRDIIADGQTGYRWLLDNGPAGLAPVRELWVAGDSAGGNLTLMLIAWARDAGLRPANGAIAISPGTDMTFSSPTLKSNLKTDLILGPSLRWFLQAPRSIRLLLIGMVNRMAPPNPLISPVFGDLSGLPPVLIQVSTAEMMLGDAWRYTNKARAAGSRVELETWPDMLHVWHLFEPILPEAQEAFERIGQFVERIRSANSA
ncbi:MAG: alpha/beta hydrolase [Candidatus Competibacteraceae bacterium]|nr:alpha/beta hydrolase [Candidatus Competibacteraceae bacterium]MBK8752797.1 alpha/beta hydrolase [Candidatus Competibacteraceae bacterium]